MEEAISDKSMGIRATSKFNSRFKCVYLVKVISQVCLIECIILTLSFNFILILLCSMASKLNQEFEDIFKVTQIKLRDVAGN